MELSLPLYYRLPRLCESSDDGGDTEDTGGVGDVLRRSSTGGCGRGSSRNSSAGSTGRAGTEGSGRVSNFLKNKWKGQALTHVEAALEVAARLVVMLEEALEEEAELEVVRGAEEDPEELEAPVVAAPPGVDEPELVKLCPMQLVSVPDWMGSSLE